MALVAVSGATWFVRAPYATLQSIKTAAERRDIPALNRMIDFPALKSSLKLLMMNAVGIQGEPESPGKGLMRMFAGALAGPVVDAMVTPESISAMFGGQLPSMRAGVPAKTGSPGSESESIAGNQEVIVARTWEGLSAVRVTLSRSASRADDGLTFVMRRDGLSWRLAAIER